MIRVTRLILGRTLTDRGCKVTACSSAEEAIEAYRLKIQSIAECVEDEFTCQKLQQTGDQAELPLFQGPISRTSLL